MATTLALLITVAPSASAEVAVEEKAGARAAATSGVEAFRQEHYEEAIDFLTRAEAIIHSPVHLTFMAQAQIKLGLLVEAKENLVNVRRDQAESSAAASSKEKAEALLGELEGRIPRLTVTISGEPHESETLTIDGKEIPRALWGIPVPVNPGTRAIALSNGEEERTAEVSLGEGESESVTLAALGGTAQSPAPKVVDHATPSDSQERLRWGSYAALGAGVLGLGLGATFGIVHNNHERKATELCEGLTGEPNCAGLPSDNATALDVQSRDQQARRAGTVSTVGFILGGAGVAVGTTLFVLSLREDKQETLGSLELVVKPSYAGLRGRF